MADHAWESVQVYLQSEGIDPPTYRSPDEGLELESDKTISRLLYTQHKPDKPFKVVIKVPVTFEKHGADDLSYDISLDGVKTNEHYELFRGMERVGSSYITTTEVTRRWDTPGKCWRHYAFKFANIVTGKLLHAYWPRFYFLTRGKTTAMTQKQSLRIQGKLAASG